MKVCYLIQTHKNPEQIYRLIRTIKKSSSNSQVIVSHDFSGCNLDVAPLDDLSGVQVLSAKGARGVDFAIFQNYLDAVEWLLSNNIDFDWLVNLTGQDYPIQPISQIENFLAETSYDGFLEYFEVFSKESHWSIREGYTRYYYKYQQIINNLPESQKQLLNSLKVINYIQPFFRINFSYGITLGFRSSTPFNENFICYGGSFFCTLSRKCIEYLYEFTQANPDVVNYYKGVCVSVESYIQTVLLNSRLFKLCNDSKRYFDFSKTRNGHPRMLTTEDYSSLVQSNAHFARKFDLNKDSNILELLDKRILPSTQEYRREASSFEI